MGPLLFLIYINDLPAVSPSAAFTLFADDTSLSRNGRTLGEAAGGLAVARLRVEEWFRANKLMLNNNKTHTLVFTLCDLSDLPQEVTHVRFLGVEIDSQLKFDAHVDYICGTLAVGTFALRGLSNSVSVEVLKTVYFSLIQSLLSYAVLVWGHSCHACRVFALQRRAIRVLAGLAYGEDCRGAFRSLGILTFPSIYIFENLLHIKHNEDQYRAHSDLHEYDTRNKANLAIIYRRLKRCQNGPGFLGVSLFNKLPSHIKALSVKNFKCKVRDFLAEQAFYSVQEFLNCEVASFI